MFNSQIFYPPFFYLIFYSREVSHYKDGNSDLTRRAITNFNETKDLLTLM